MPDGTDTLRDRSRAAGLPVFEIALALTLLLLLTFGAVAQTSRTPARILEPVDMGKLVKLSGNTHPLARAEYDRGAAPDELPMDHMLLVLKRSPAQEELLRQLLDEQQVKSSSHYHQWLTPAQFGEQFGPADSDVQTVTDWLTSEGFQIDRVPAGRTVIEFTGTAGLVRDAFSTEIHKYVVNGEAHWANASDPEIPSALAPVVAGIASLNNFPVRRMSHQIGVFSRSKTTGEITPLFSFTNASGTFHALGPGDFATIYNLQPLWLAGVNGTGQTIAIVAQSNINLQDVRNFRSLFGLPVNDPHVILNGPDPGMVQGDEGESDLDVEWAGAVAQNATIDLVVSESNEDGSGIDLSALYAVENNIAPVLSVSYGVCEASLGVAGNAFYSTLWEQAAAQGITVVVAAGDGGSAGCRQPGQLAAEKGLSVSGTASTPFNVAVGGTDFDDASNSATYWRSTNDPQSQSSALSYIPESTWNDSCAAGGTNDCTSTSSGVILNLAGGGGPSTCGILSGVDPAATCDKGYPKPSWQSGAGVPSDGVRDLPDLSLFAGDGKNGSFYVMCEADSNPNANGSCDLNAPYRDFQAAGGTSTSAQTFAGIMALVNQKTGARQGNANYVLYKLAAQPSASCPSNPAAVSISSCIFYDVIIGNNSIACQAGSPNCGPAPAGGDGTIIDPANTSLPAWTAGPGYDLATGLGSVDAANLVNDWASVSFTPTTTQLITLSPTVIAHGQPVNVSVQVSSSSGVPTGQVSLIGGPGNNALGIADFTLSNGAATGSTTFLPGGTYGVTAHYAGDGNFAASSSAPPIQVTVNKEGSQTHLGIISMSLTGAIVSMNATSFTYGSPYVLQVNVTNAAGVACANNQLPAYGCATGTVNLTDNGAPLDLGAYNLNSLGELEDQPIQLPPGSHNLSAAYTGDNSFNGSTSSADPVTVSQASTTTTLTASSSSVQGGTSVTLTALISTTSNGASPSAPVQFLNGPTPISGAVTYSPPASPGTGYAQLQATLATTLASTATITASYSGDSNYTGSVSAPVTVSVVPGFNFSANPTSINVVSPGQSAASTLTVAANGGFNGTVAFSCQVPTAMTETTCSLSPASLNASGTTALTVITTAPHTVAALFGNLDWFLGSGLFILGCLAFLSILDRRRLRWAFSILALCLLAATLVACGGGSGPGTGNTVTDPGTPVGTYTITVTATSGSISHNADVSVTVQ